MNYNKLQIGILTLSVLINGLLVYLFLLKGETTTSTDNRIALTLNESNREFVMAEMREFLESVQQINEGILKEDPTLIIAAGKKSGGSVIAHAPQGLMKSLPIGFKKMGFATHAIFDEFTHIDTKNFDSKQAQTKLNKLLNNCIACHKGYKINLKVSPHK